MSTATEHRCRARSPITQRRCRLVSLHSSPHRWWWGSGFWAAGKRREEW